jgi:hypothetical protein
MVDLAERGANVAFLHQMLTLARMARKAQTAHQVSPEVLLHDRKFVGPAVAVLPLLYFRVLIGFSSQNEDSE